MYVTTTQTETIRPNRSARAASASPRARGVCCRMRRAIPTRAAPPPRRPRRARRESSAARHHPRVSTAAMERDVKMATVPSKVTRAKARRSGADAMAGSSRPSLSSLGAECRRRSATAPRRRRSATAPCRRRPAAPAAEASLPPQLRSQPPTSSQWCHRQNPSSIRAAAAGGGCRCSSSPCAGPSASLS